MHRIYIVYLLLRATYVCIANIGYTSKFNAETCHELFKTVLSLEQERIQEIWGEGFI